MRRQRKPPPLDKQSEKQFQQTVIEFLQLHGWKVAHFAAARTKKGWRTPARANGKGWLDIYALHPVNRWKLVAELKVEPNVLTDEQKEWKAWHELCGTPAYSWYPHEWAEIEQVARFGPD
jgi:hypothetical protein